MTTRLPIHAQPSTKRVLLTISTTHRPATDLGYLLHKNPSRVHSSDLSFGTAYAFYTRGDGGPMHRRPLAGGRPGRALPRAGMRGGLPLQPYVNDRPYAASSFLSAAIADLFRSAIRGPEPGAPRAGRNSHPIEVRIAALP